SVEANILERPMNATLITTTFPAGGAINRVVNHTTAFRAWEYPLLLKYTPGTGRLRPFLEAGPSFRSQENATAVEPSHVGITTGAGASLHYSIFRVEPSLR